MKFSFFLIAAVLFSCNASRKQIEVNAATQKNNNSLQSDKVKENNPVDYSIGPATIIYKTKNDYFDKISVTLNDDKTKIVSYPGPKDVYYNGQLAYPTKLNNGYMLDNRGINKNTAFLNITYEEYSKRTEAPSLSEMMNMIIDKEPFIEIYNCGTRYQYKDIVNDLNKVIDFIRYILSIKVNNFFYFMKYNFTDLFIIIH